MYNVGKIEIPDKASLKVSVELRTNDESTIISMRRHDAPCQRINEGNGYTPSRCSD